MVLMLSGALGRILAAVGDLIGALPSYIVMSAGQTVRVLVPLLDSTAAIYLIAVFWFYLLRRYVCDFGVHANDGFGQIAARAMSITSFFGWFGMGAGDLWGGICSI